MNSLKENTNLLTGKNPLLISTIVRCVLGFSNLEDLKQYRFVCHEWNSAARSLMVKRSKIVFSYIFPPGNYMEYLSSSSPLPCLPFSSFEFSSLSNHPGWCILELKEFLTKWGKNVKRLDFKYTFLLSRHMECAAQFAINPLIDLVQNSLIELKIEYCATRFSLRLNKLAKIKILSLSDCDLLVNSNANRIVPIKISLQNVTFKDSGNQLVNPVVNDFVDFSKCSHIQIISAMTFDLARDVFNAVKIHFCDIRVINWGTTKGKTEYLQLLECPFEEKTQMEFKQLNCGRSKMNLTFLPKTIERLTLFRNTFSLNNHESLDLPNLKSLCFSPDIVNTETRFSTHSIIIPFANCSNLIDLELHGGMTSSFFCRLSLSWLPKNVRRLRIANPMTFRLGDIYQEINLQVLILEYSSCSFTQTILNKINPKILVVSIVWVDEETSDDFISLILRNKHIQKIFVEIHQGVQNSKPFEQSRFSKYVDQNSKYYEFTNQLGKSITREKYKSYSVISQGSVPLRGEMNPRMDIM